MTRLHPFDCELPSTKRLSPCLGSNHVTNRKPLMIRPSTPQRPASIVILTALVLAGTAQAAPATADEVSGTESPTVHSYGAPGLPSAGVPLPAVSGAPQSRTVELLLQLQDRPQGLADNERASGSATGQRVRALVPAVPSSNGAPAAAADASPLAQLKTAILGGSSNAPLTGGTGVREASESAMGREPGQSLSSMRTDSARSGYRDPGNNLLANPVVQFIREHRVLTVGASLAALAAVWLTANFSYRRRRR